MEKTISPEQPQQSESENKKKPSLEGSADSRPSKTMGKLYRMPAKGFAFNPLRKLDRNMLCPCQSGKKFKKCHLDLLPEVVPQKQAEIYKQTMKAHKHLRFVTGDQQAAVPETAVDQDDPTPDQAG
jgi:uncharacterized protein YecA (UPF0149 family)